MVEKFHTELDALRNEVLNMGRLSLDMLLKSVSSLKEKDEKEAAWVISQRDNLEYKDRDIEEKALHLVALYQPMAKDLRMIACILKMITYVTRIGQYGINIARLLPEVAGKDVPPAARIPHMAHLASTMVKDALNAFETEDVQAFADFSARDDLVDTLRHSIFSECVVHMKKDPDLITACIHYIMIARYLERCADHSRKMAEKITYMVTGQHTQVR